MPDQDTAPQPFAVATQGDSADRVVLTVDVDTAREMLVDLFRAPQPYGWKFRVVAALAGELSHPAYTHPAYGPPVVLGTPWWAER